MMKIISTNYGNAEVLHRRDKNELDSQICKDDFTWNTGKLQVKRNSFFVPLIQWCIAVGMLNIPLGMAFINKWHITNTSDCLFNFQMFRILKFHFTFKLFNDLFKCRHCFKFMKELQIVIILCFCLMIELSRYSRGHKLTHECYRRIGGPFLVVCRGKSVYHWTGSVQQ